MPLGSGRKKGSEWDEVSEIDGSNNKVSCDHCFEEISKKIERIRQHIQKCKSRLKNLSKTEDEIFLPSPVISTPVTPLSLQAGSSRSDEESFIIDKSDLSKEGPAASSTPAKGCKRQKTLSGFITRTSNEEKDSIDLKLAKYFFSSNISFSGVENKHFINLCTALRPGYKPPNRKLLGGQLLDSVHDEICEKIKGDISRSKNVVLIQDGWSNIRNDPIVAHSIYNGSKPYLLSVKDTGSAKKTAEFCAELVKEAIEEINVAYDSQVFAVCTDNEPRMVRMKEILKEEFPKILTYGCNAHHMNLLEKDASNATIMKQIVEVQKYFRNIHQAHGWLREKNGLMPQIPNDTRWNSQIEALETYQKNYPIYLEIHNENIESFPANIGKIIDNVGIKREASNLLTQMKHFSCALDKFQNDGCHLSDAVHTWLRLLKNEDLVMHKENIMKMFRNAMESFHFLAYMRDHRYMDETLLDSENEDEAENWLFTHFPEFVSPFLKLKLKDSSIFPEHMFAINRKDINPTSWWMLIKMRNDKIQKLPEGFCDFFMHFNAVPQAQDLLRGSSQRLG